MKNEESRLEKLRKLGKKLQKKNEKRHKKLRKMGFQVKNNAKKNKGSQVQKMKKNK